MQKAMELGAIEKDREKYRMGKLLLDYQSSAEFAQLRESTQAYYGRTISELAKIVGDFPYNKLDRKGVLRLRDLYAETPRKADTIVGLLSVVFSWAMDRELVTANPCIGVKALRPPSKRPGYRAWEPEEIIKFTEHATPEEFAMFALALYTGQRAGDLVRIRWADIDAGVIRLAQAKTGAVMTLPVHAALAEALARIERRGETVLASRDGRPLAPNNLSNRMRSALARAGIEGVTLHGLRATHAKLLAEAGASVRQIAASTGHASLAMVSRYTRNASQAQLAAGLAEQLPPVAHGSRKGASTPSMDNGHET